MRNASVVIIALSVWGGAGPVYGQTDLLVGGVVADSSVIAPIVELQRHTASDSTWRAGIAGWMVSGGYEKRLIGRRAAALEVELTPLHARSSDHIYERGERLSDDGYDHAAVELRARYSLARSERWKSSAAFVILYNDVSGIDSRTDAFWRNPYGGIQVEQSYRRIRSEDPLSGDSLGFHTSALAEALTGDHQWWRASVRESWSSKNGLLRYGQTAAVLTGHSLNSPTQFLVGGAWNGRWEVALPGFRYAEFRVDEAFIGTAWGSLQVRRNLRVTLRAGGMAAEGVRAVGASAELSGRLQGAAWSAGIGIPRQREAVTESPTIYLMLTAGAFR